MLSWLVISGRLFKQDINVGFTAVVSRCKIDCNKHEFALSGTLSLEPRLSRLSRVDCEMILAFVPRNLDWEQNALKQRVAPSLNDRVLLFLGMESNGAGNAGGRGAFPPAPLCCSHVCYGSHQNRSELGQLAGIRHISSQVNPFTERDGAYIGGWGGEGSPSLCGGLF